MNPNERMTRRAAIGAIVGAVAAGTAGAESELSLENGNKVERGGIIIAATAFMYALIKRERGKARRSSTILQATERQAPVQQSGAVIPQMQQGPERHEAGIDVPLTFYPGLYPFSPNTHTPDDDSDHDSVLNSFGSDNEPEYPSGTPITARSDAAEYLEALEDMAPGNAFDAIDNIRDEAGLFHGDDVRDIVIDTYGDARTGLEALEDAVARGDLPASIQDDIDTIQEDMGFEDQDDTDINFDGDNDGDSENGDSGNGDNGYGDGNGNGDGDGGDGGNGGE